MVCESSRRRSKSFNIASEKYTRSHTSKDTYQYDWQILRKTGHYSNATGNIIKILQWTAYNLLQNRQGQQWSIKRIEYRCRNNWVEFYDAQVSRVKKSWVQSGNHPNFASECASEVALLGTNCLLQLKRIELLHSNAFNSQYVSHFGSRRVNECFSTSERQISMAISCSPWYQVSPGICQCDRERTEIVAIKKEVPLWEWEGKE